MWRNRLGVCLFTALLATGCGSGDSSQFDGGADGAAADGTIFGGGDGSGFNPDASSGCQPKTCASQGYTCGQNGDGCGNVINCGTCTSPNFCGGGGYSQCGVGTTADGGPIVSDGGGACTPTTCQQLGFNCGPAGDGCGGLLDCGTCVAPDTCGGGGQSGVCGGTTVK